MTVVWKPTQCIHSGICFNGLGKVFDPQKHPWITPEGATSDKIIEQIKKCPSGALSYYRNDQTQDNVIVNAETIVETVLNGPLLVYGNVTVKDSGGTLTKKNKVTAFCRCGGSSTKPFCDGTHRSNGFQG